MFLILFVSNSGFEDMLSLQISASQILIGLFYEGIISTAITEKCLLDSIHTLFKFNFKNVFQIILKMEY